MSTITSRPTVFLIFAVLAAGGLSACGSGGGGGNGTAFHGNAKAVCEDLNGTQRAATKLGEDLSAATSNDQSESLTNEANAVNKDLSSALASGDFIGTPGQNDLQTAIHAVQQIENDLLKPNVAQASLDFGSLKNAMANLGGDCSRYLT